MRLASSSCSRSAIGSAKQEAEHEAGESHAEREPEARADDEPAAGVVLGVEVEAEEGGGDAEAEDRDGDRGERDDEADGAEVLPVEVPRVERQQEDGEDARDEPAEAVDRRVAAEPPELRAEAHGAVEKVPDTFFPALGPFLEPSVEVEQAVGDPLEVVHALDVGARRGAEAAPFGRAGGDELGKPVAQRLLRRVDDRHAQSEGLLGAANRLVVQERDDRLAERHRLDRQQAVPAALSWSTTMSAAR